MRDVFGCERGRRTLVRVVVYNTVTEWWRGWCAWGAVVNYCLTDERY